MTPYADVDYYTNVYEGTDIPSDELKKVLIQASKHIDTLTYNRIVGKGIDALTEFQQDIIRECCCALADFEYINADMINSILKSYSINGTSMTFDSGWSCSMHKGVVIKNDIYSELQKTGLTCRTLRW